MVSGEFHAGLLLESMASAVYIVKIYRKKAGDAAAQNGKTRISQMKHKSVGVGARFSYSRIEAPIMARPAGEDGRGRYLTAFIRRHSAAHRGTSIALVTPTA
jgi:hypothetical protein